MSSFKILLILLVVVGGLLSNVVLANTTTILRPIADGGDDSADWENSDGTACNTINCYCYTEVYELSGASCTNSDGDTSYINSKVVAARQTFDINESSIPNDSTVTRIDITICSRKEQNGAAFQTRYCHNGSCSDSGITISPNEIYTENTQGHVVNFTKTLGSDIEIGITDKAGKKIRISQISAVITYTLPGEEPEEPGLDVSAGRIVEVVFSGQAYPGSKIEVLRRGSLDENASYLTVPLETHKVSDDGTFDLSLGVLVSDEYFFALRVEDKDGRKTGIIAFNVDLKTTNILEARDIFMPPTVELEKTVAARGKEINIFGYAGPKNFIEVEIGGSIVKTTEVGEDGHWTTAISTSALTPREYAVKVRQVDCSGQKSRFSLTKSFKISLLKFPEVDFNGDGIINITDWSVFLFRWGQDDESTRYTIDLNKDGKINISDFSIFLNMMKIQ